MLQKKITFDSFIRGILSGIVIIGILYLVNRLSGVLLPFFVAWLIAYLIYPMVTFFQYKLRLKNRVISIFAVMLVLICIGILTFIGLVPPIVEEFGKLKYPIFSLVITVIIFSITVITRIPGVRGWKIPVLFLHYLFF